MSSWKYFSMSYNDYLEFLLIQMYFFLHFSQKPNYAAGGNSQSNMSSKFIGKLSNF